MGMFSWVCKGCGYELCEYEHVMLDGTTQDYDGYGGSAAKVGNYEPVAWHVSCYRNASIAEKQCNKPSLRATNQGFGPPKLEFKEFANLHKDTTCKVDIDCSWENPATHSYERAELVLTEKGELTEVEEHGRWPTHAQFDSLDEALKAIDALLPGALPVRCGGEYELYVTGTQSDAFGCVYHRVARKPITWVGDTYTIGDTLEIEVKYDIRERTEQIREQRLAKLPQTENARLRIVVWDEPLKIVEGLLTATDADNPTLMRVRDAMMQAAGKSPANVIGVKEFPWMCCNCGEVWA